MKTTKKTATKWLAAIAAVMMAFSFVSCGSDDGGSGNTDTNTENTNTNSDNSGTENGDNSDNNNSSGSGTENTNTNNGSGTVAETKTAPDAVGDVVLSDGTAVSAANASKMSDAQKAAAVAVIFYAGSADDLLGAKTLGVGLKNTQGETTPTLQWAKSSVYNITAIQCTVSLTDGSYDNASTATFTGDLDGSDNWAALCAAVSDEGTSGNYPAWEWVNAYGTTNSLTGDYASGWYLPTVAELSALYRVKSTVNTALESAGGTKIADRSYWSSSQCDYNGNTNLFVWDVWFDGGRIYYYDKTRNLSVCAIRAF